MVNEEGLADTDIEAGMITDDDHCLENDKDLGASYATDCTAPPRRMQRPPSSWTGPAIGWEPVPQAMPAPDDAYSPAQPYEDWEDDEWMGI